MTWTTEKFVQWALDRKLIDALELRQLAIAALIQTRIDEYVRLRKSETNNEY